MLVNLFMVFLNQIFIYYGLIYAKNYLRLQYIVTEIGV